MLLKDKRVARQYGYSARGTWPVLRDHSYARWAPHYSCISAISSEGLIANRLLKNPDERFDARSFIQFLDEQLLPAMNPFDGRNSQSVLVMGKNKLTNKHACRIGLKRPLTVRNSSVVRHEQTLFFTFHCRSVAKPLGPLTVTNVRFPFSPEHSSSIITRGDN